MQTSASLRSETVLGLPLAGRFLGGAPAEGTPWRGPRRRRRAGQAAVGVAALEEEASAERPASGR